MKFKDARRENVWLRTLLMAPHGAGKTLAALELASNLFDGSLPVYVIDTEHDRAKLYADRFTFKHLTMAGDFSPEAYIAAIDLAEKSGAGVLIIDSVTQEWAGQNGVLQQADRFGDWKAIRPRHTAFIERMLSTRCHLIATVRTKMKYEVDEVEVNGKTKQRITPLGLGPIQDDTLAYEFDILARLDLETHEATFSNRCSPLVGVTREVDADVARIVTSWLSEGEPPAPPVPAEPTAVDVLVGMLLEEGIDGSLIEEKFEIQRRANHGQLSAEYVSEQTAKARERAAARKAAAAKAEPAAA